VRQDSPAGQHGVGRPPSDLTVVEDGRTFFGDLAERVRQIGNMDHITFGNRRPVGMMGDRATRVVPTEYQPMRVVEVFG